MKATPRLREGRHFGLREVGELFDHLGDVLGVLRRRVGAVPEQALVRFIGHSSTLSVNGASLNDVRAAQRMLFQLGYDPGPIDGRLGSNTRSALERFQMDHGLYGSGAFDDGTITALTEATSQQQLSPEPNVAEHDQIEVRPLDPAPKDTNDGSAVSIDAIDTRQQSASNSVPAATTIEGAAKVSRNDASHAVLVAQLPGILALLF